MRNKTLPLVILFCSLSISLAAQKTSEPKMNKMALFKERDVAYSEKGFAYKFRMDAPGSNAVLNNVVQFHFTLKNDKDSLLRSTVKEKNPVITTVQKSFFPGACLRMMSKGDSTTFWVLADSLFNKNTGSQMPPFLKPGTYLRFDVKMLDVSTMEEYIKQQEEMAKDSKVKEDQQLADYIKEKNIPAKLDPETGLYYQVIKEGTGAYAKNRDSVSVHYTGRLLNGEIFDSSVERNQPFQFVLGQGYVIEGWDKGIPLMRKGEKGILYIPSYMGYGSKGVGSIPPNSILIFEVELINAK